MEHGLVKVTIIGYYLVSDQELENYGLEEFHVAAMAKVDQNSYNAQQVDPREIIDWFRDERPTSVNFEAVDMDVPEC
jgi:hypothetical protein